MTHTASITYTLTQHNARLIAQHSNIIAILLSRELGFHPMSRANGFVQVRVCYQEQLNAEYVQQ